AIAEHTFLMHQERVLSYCRVAQEEGGELLLGGKAPSHPDLQKGCFVEPTVVRAKSINDRVCQEEVFGPFVVVSTFKNDEEALAMANNTIYGLGGGLWTNNLQRAHLMARHMEAGMVWINCYKRFHPGSPFGGVKDSGYGREMGHFAMHEYTEPKSVWVNIDAKIPVFYPR
ncbi:MAG: aldehyde dehydrogenase family protein, partial [Gammaproteobacteria bacterium]